MKLREVTTELSSHSKLYEWNTDFPVPGKAYRLRGGHHSNWVDDEEAPEVGDVLLSIGFAHDSSRQHLLVFLGPNGKMVCWGHYWSDDQELPTLEAM